jgi:nucleotide-binding universal stress UspA family protein
MTTIAPQAALALRNILIASDFSPCSERALMHAVAAAHHFGSTLHMLHVVDTQFSWYSSPEGFASTPEAALEIARNDARKSVMEALERTHLENTKHRTHIEVGSVSATLHNFIKREHIDLAVVGTHGRTGLSRMVLGSVAEELFRHADCPVLTVGPHSRRTDPQTLEMKHILFPTDLTRESARALPLVRGIAAEFGARLSVMHVVEHLEGEAAHDRPRVISVLEQKMRDMVSAEGAMPAAVDFIVEFGGVAENVIATSAQKRVDLVAFGLKAPDTYVDRLPWIHAYRIVCQVGCPVLSLRGVSA